MESSDLARFEATVLPYLDAAHNLARYLLRDASDAQDAVQEACLRALRYFDGWRGGDPRAWLLAIVRNTCRTWRARSRSGAGAVEFDEATHSDAIADEHPEADLDRATARASVHEALNRLEPDFREVLVLRELEGLSYKEIADVTGVPVGTVMSRLSRARARLRRALGEGEGEGEGEREGEGG